MNNNTQNELFENQLTDSSKKEPVIPVLEALDLGPFKTNTVIQIESILAMSQLPAESIDIAVIDPPYNVSKGGEWKWDSSSKLKGLGGDWGKVIEEWDKFELKDYLDFTFAWATEIKRIVKPTGSIWVHGTYHNIGLINFVFQLLEIEMINEVIWYKRNSFPNLSGRRLTASHETIIWAHTGKTRKYQFNYDYSKESFFPEDQLKAKSKQMRTVWDVPNNKEQRELKFGKHPTQKPLRLIKRMINISSSPNQVLLSPFAGSGTDCLAAKELGLHYLGFDLNEDYIELAKTRLGIN
jgi:site-specific DNA-methyltransferase (adenine-specific)